LASTVFFFAGFEDDGLGLFFAMVLLRGRGWATRTSLSPEGALPEVNNPSTVP